MQPTRDPARWPDDPLPSGPPEPRESGPTSRGPAPVTHHGPVRRVRGPGGSGGARSDPIPDVLAPGQDPLPEPPLPPFGFAFALALPRRRALDPWGLPPPLRRAVRARARDPLEPEERGVTTRGARGTEILGDETREDPLRRGTARTPAPEEPPAPGRTRTDGRLTADEPPLPPGTRTVGRRGVARRLESPWPMGARIGPGGTARARTSPVSGRGEVRRIALSRSGMRGLRGDVRGTALREPESPPGVRRGVIARRDSGDVGRGSVPVGA